MNRSILNAGLSRRDFFRNSFLLGGIAVVLPELFSCSDKSVSEDASAASKIKINDGDVILFQGDSITEAGRYRPEASPNVASALGSGYARFAADLLLSNPNYKGLKIYNRGVGGNTVPDLLDRWNSDCIDLKPNILSILIGINDFNRGMSVKDFNKNYGKLLDIAVSKLSDVKIILGEPFIIAYDSSKLDDYRNVVKTAASKYKTVFIPYQEVFENALKNISPEHYSADSVHPSVEGAKLMSKAWLSAVE